MKYYFVGIKGSGMSSLAIMLKENGNEIIGSDSNEDYFTCQSLYEKGIKILEFNSDNICNDYFYIIGNAYGYDNVEVSKIISEGYEYIYYHDFIGTKLNKRIIACSGTHGKTTTTYFITNFLEHKCNYIIGDGEGGGYNNDLLVLEACEYKEHFSSYYPDILIINNIELDHTDYYKNNKMLINAFQKVANQSKILLINGDDKNCQKILHQNKVTFGFNENNDAIIKILIQNDNGYYILLSYKKDVYLKIPYLGKHMIYNYVAGYLACVLYGIKPSTKDVFNLPKRRMEITEFKKSTIITDYAHHPTEIKALFDSVKLMYPNDKINVVFQPHTYERTMRFKKQFKKSLKLFDNVYMMDVFSSKREETSYKKQKRIDKYFRCFNKYSEDVLNLIHSSNCIWILLGAGSADSIINRL